MIIATDMPEVSRCAVTQCAYNANDGCHARAITIGNGIDPDCDTFLANSKHTNSARTAGVGACKMENCKFNDDFECSADSIQVGRSGNSNNCLNYTH
ncbi:MULTISPECIES: DUF1540 domain-containing protein [unclassified Microbulbifer]|uniref:DUF1540 domain-containing protein n=1 Tax=Microbulbifer spongiae TaxID=2944933 RepID=A0ABY9EDA0_9GAMM|nr:MULTISPECIES: DUF1540 domain-containing protein [unclassified Microbulbifer]MDP5210060.1 DUF1540 domain-containing protein [Microbulbifer sp. 2205BS26-8]WKD48711.1 DUF1540 domain-containing protein [Microbulbifer sp. MI-G]